MACKAVYFSKWSSYYFFLARGEFVKVILSPLLFCLVEDVLNRVIAALASFGDIKLMSGPRGCSTTMDVLYVNVIMVFCKGTKKNLANLMSLFNEYGQVSSQHLSQAKSKCFAPLCLLLGSMIWRIFLGFLQELLLSLTQAFP